MKKNYKIKNIIENLLLKIQNKDQVLNSINKCNSKINKEEKLIILILTIRKQDKINMYRIIRIIIIDLIYIK